MIGDLAVWTLCDISRKISFVSVNLKPFIFKACRINFASVPKSIQQAFKMKNLIFLNTKDDFVNILLVTFVFHEFSTNFSFKKTVDLEIY